MDNSRRRFLGISAAALAGVSLVPTMISCADKAAPSAAPVSGGKPDSNFGGVHFGTITYSWRDMPGGLDNLLKYCREANVSNLELMSNDLEACLGAPVSPMNEIRRQMAAQAPAGGGPGGPGGPGGRPSYTPEQQALIDKYNQDVKNFRTNMDWDKVAEVRKRFNDENIFIHIVKTNPSANSTEEDLDYGFKLAKAMGAVGVTTELSLDTAKHVAPSAEKHDMYLIFHNHMQYSTDEWKDGPDPVLAISPKVMLNFDSGHYFGSTGKHPVEFIKKYKDRIVSLHIKDKTGPQTQPEPNANQVWGQGETPLDELFSYLRDEKLPIYPDIELEYQVKPWSNSVKEVGTCIKYIRQIMI